MEKKIIAVDFDGTLCKNKYPEIGEPFETTISLVKDLKKDGNKIILWTCRVGKMLDEAVAWCEKQGLEFDAINEQESEHLKKYEEDTRKVYADMYIDNNSCNPLFNARMTAVIDEINQRNREYVEKDEEAKKRILEATIDVFVSEIIKGWKHSVPIKEIKEKAKKFVKGESL